MTYYNEKKTNKKDIIFFKYNVLKGTMSIVKIVIVLNLNVKS